MGVTTALQWLELNQRALLHNFQVFVKIVGEKTAVLPVIKANAYGHGILEVARTLQAHARYGFAVASLEEAIILRRAGIRQPLIVLSFWTPEQLQELGSVRKIAFVVHDLAQARKAEDYGRQHGVVLDIHLKLDTGTHRIGFSPEEFAHNLRTIRSMSHLRLRGVFSHFADAEAARQTFTRKQIREFRNAVNILAGHDPSCQLHMSCTAAILTQPSAHFQAVRLGIGLYGLWPSHAVRSFVAKRFPHLRLQPVLTWKARVLQVKTLQAGDTVGYGRTFRVRRTLRMAVLPVGYADGYDRGLSSCGMVLIRGKHCPVIGRVCMNLTMVDVTRLRGVRPGDAAVLLGRQGRETVSAEDIARKLGTINYEVVTRIRHDLPRVLI